VSRCLNYSFNVPLRTATLALIHSVVEYCAPVWCRSKHTRLVDKLIHDALWSATGCLRPTPIDNLFDLAGITLIELRRKRATLSNPPCNGPRAPSPQSTPVHTNYTTAWTQIEATFCIGCAGTIERPREVLYHYSFLGGS